MVHTFTFGTRGPDIVPFSERGEKMRNLLALLALVLLLVAGLGWYLDWFKVKSQPAEAGHHNVSIDIDKKKITQDIQKGEEKLHQMLENAKDKAPGNKIPGKAQPPRSDLGALPTGSAEASEPPLPAGNVFGPAIPPPSPKK
jgi:hypothetical protein